LAQATVVAVSLTASVRVLENISAHQYLAAPAENAKYGNEHRSQQSSDLKNLI
jgi:hypothetical protein